MNTAEIIKGIDMTIRGLTTIKDALEVQTTTSDVGNPVSSQEEETNSNVVAKGKFDAEQLRSMKYNEFKKLAASLGVKCTGTRDEIMERILALDVNITEDGETVVSDPSVEEEAPVAKEVVAEEDDKSDRPSSGKRKVAKKVSNPARDEFDEQAERIASDTPVEDIIEALADVKVKATNKNVVAKLAQALRDGLIEVDEDDEGSEDSSEEEDEDTVDVDADSEDEEDDSSDEDEEGEIEADSYFSQYDPKGYNDPDTMSDERKEAVVAKMDDILTAVSEEKLSFSDIEKYIEEHATQDEIDLLGEEYDETEELKLYMELVKRTIDNDGDEHTEGEDPYELGEHDMCCGHELKYAKKTKKYICEVCGTEYEAE